MNKNFGEAHASLGFCYLLEEESDKSIAELKASHNLGFETAKTHLNLGCAYLKKVIWIIPYGNFKSL